MAPNCFKSFDIGTLLSASSDVISAVVLKSSVHGHHKLHNVHLALISCIYNELSSDPHFYLTVEFSLQIGNETFLKSDSLNKQVSVSSNFVIKFCGLSLVQLIFANEELNFLETSPLPLNSCQVLRNSQHVLWDEC